MRYDRDRSSIFLLFSTPFPLRRGTKGKTKRIEGTPFQAGLLDAPFPDFPIIIHSSEVAHKKWCTSGGFVFVPHCHSIAVILTHVDTRRTKAERFWQAGVLNKRSRARMSSI